jgi:hypothetical protein
LKGRTGRRTHSEERKRERRKKEDRRAKSKKAAGERRMIKRYLGRRQDFPCISERTFLLQVARNSLGQHLRG